MKIHTGTILTIASALVSCQAPGTANSINLASVFDGSAGTWVDLTHTLSEDAVFWPTVEPFRMVQVAYGMTDAGYFYAANNFSAAEHGGTHLDAPIHFSEGKNTTDQIPLSQLIGPAVVVDVVNRVEPDYLVTPQDLEQWESAHGQIPEGSIVLFRTGWGDRWPDRERYLGTATMGPAAVPELHFPGLAPETARWLVENRSVDAVGIDTPSIDYGQSSTFEAHRILYGANIPGFENVANLDRLPEAGSYVVALPTKIGGGSGGPLRIVAFVPNGQ